MLLLYCIYNVYIYPIFPSIAILKLHISHFLHNYDCGYLGMAV